MNKRPFTTLLMFLLALVSIGCETDATEEPPQVIAFTTLEKANQSRIRKSRFAVIKDLDTWQSLWEEHRLFQHVMPVPASGFAETMVLGVFLGTRPSTCYSVTIESVEQTPGQRLTVKYRETKPADDWICGDMMTAPYHLISVPAMDLPVEFIELQ